MALLGTLPSSLATTVTLSNQKLGFLNQLLTKLLSFWPPSSSINGHHFNADSLKLLVYPGWLGLIDLHPIASINDKIHASALPQSELSPQTGCLSLCAAIDFWLTVMLAHMILKNPNQI